MQLQIEEVTKKESQAGKYKSFLNIESNDSKKIEKCVDEIRKSKNKKILNDIFFVQEMVPNVKISGVILTKSLINYSKCLIINYSRGKDTSTVTSGSGENQSLIYFTNKKYII